MRRLLLTSAATLLCLGAAAFHIPSSVKGTVKDTDGKPIAGVVVSDGIQVVTTGNDGKYEFPRISEAYFVFVSIPSAYEVPLRQGQPAFYKKLGDDKTYDFVLKPLKKGPEKEFNLFLIADPQCQRISHVRRLATEAIPDMKAYARKRRGACYALTLGDIGYSENARNTNYLLPIIRDEMAAEKAGMPVFQTVGNHDFEYDLAALEPSSPTISIRRNRMYESVFGPVNYSFNRGDVHFVSMNDVVFETFGYPGKYHGDFTDEQVEWLRADLAAVPEDKLVILSVHIPFEGIKNKGNVPAVMDLLASRPNVYIVSGHTHTIKRLEYSNGVREFVAGAMSGCWWWSKNCADGSPNGYAVWKISGNKVVDQIYKGQNFKDSYQMRMYRGNSRFGGEYESFELAHGGNTVLINAWNWDKDWKIEVYENGKLAGTPEKMPTSKEFNAPYDGGKDWWAIGYNVGVVGRGHKNGSTRNNYCSKNYHMFKYTLKDPSAKVKVVAYDGYGRKFTCNEFTGAEDYARLAAPPAYEADPAW